MSSPVPTEIKPAGASCQRSFWRNGDYDITNFQESHRSIHLFVGFQADQELPKQKTVNSGVAVASYSVTATCLPAGVLLCHANYTRERSVTGQERSLPTNASRRNGTSCRFYQRGGEAGGTVSIYIPINESAYQEVPGSSGGLAAGLIPSMSMMVICVEELSSSSGWQGNQQR